MKVLFREVQCPDCGADRQGLPVRVWRDSLSYRCGCGAIFRVMRWGSDGVTVMAAEVLEGMKRTVAGSLRALTVGFAEMGAGVIRVLDESRGKGWMPWPPHEVRHEGERRVVLKRMERDLP